MSKILVLDDRQFQELKRIFESTMQNSFIPQDLETTSFYDSIQRAFEDAEKKNRSVLEWHDVKEAPSSNAERVFVERSDGSFGFVFGHPEIIKDDPDYKRWAYLPE
jgi:hypothetical protein